MSTDSPQSISPPKQASNTSVQAQIAKYFSSDQETLSTLITGAHILAYHKILDGFGHITARSPTNTSIFYYTPLPHALIKTPEDFTIFNIADGTPFDPSTKISPYSEHYIHAGFYATYPEVNSVVHSHARETIPFGLLTNSSSSSSSTPLSSTSPHFRSVTHTSGFLGQSVPIWDAAAVYPTQYPQSSSQAPHPHNLLVNTYALGRSLAAASNGHSLILQRGHGFTATGTTVPEAVYNSYYTVENAIVLTTAVALTSGSGGSSGIRALSPDEVEACTTMNSASVGKVWPLWVAQVERSGFFRAG